jgi:hypothetical protein
LLRLGGQLRHGLRHAVLHVDGGQVRIGPAAKVMFRL